jgi:electron transport complex protein RnfD
MIPIKVVQTTPSSPHLVSKGSVRRVMLMVMAALLPGAALYSYFFGWGVVVNIILALASAVTFEAIMLLIRKKPVLRFVGDGSAMLTGLLLALSLPPMTSWWLPVIGCFIAIVVAKQLYGGLGYNPFNPAMAAFAVLLISFPVEMSQWLAPSAVQVHALSFWDAWQFSWSGRLPDNMLFDQMTAATPLDKLKTDLRQGIVVGEIMHAPVFGYLAGRGAEWVSAAYLVGGAALIALRIISWHIPVSMLLALAAFAGIGQLMDPQHSVSLSIHLLAGATMLGAFFIATDPVTAATTPVGKLIYGAGIGALVFAIRTWGNYPDGVAFAVLLMGLTVPLLDQYALPRIFGARREG